MVMAVTDNVLLFASTFYFSLFTGFALLLQLGFFSASPSRQPDSTEYKESNRHACYRDIVRVCS